MQVIHCTEAHLDVLSELFNEYRIFYEQPSDVPACRAFIQQNLQQNRSKIFLLLDDEGGAVGFSQLYPSVCSISMRPFTTSPTCTWPSPPAGTGTRVT